MNETPDPVLEWFNAQRCSAPADKRPLTEAEREALFETFGATWQAMSKCRGA